MIQIRITCKLDFTPDFWGFSEGVTLHDIRFKGERIVYELSLQEQYVAYSGYGGSGQSMYFDSAIGLGLSMLPLRRGLDCPEQALYLPIFIMGVFTSRSRTQNIDAICIFEEDSQITEWRHTHLRGRALQEKSVLYMDFLFLEKNSELHSYVPYS